MLAVSDNASWPSVEHKYGLDVSMPLLLLLLQ
jgi:hypothetical protein